jgi:hypothetical protein
MVLLAGALSLSLSTLLAFVFEALGNPESRRRMDAVFRS